MEKTVAFTKADMAGSGITSSHFAGQAKLHADLERAGDALHLHPGAVINEQLMRRHCEQTRGSSPSHN